MLLMFVDPFTFVTTEPGHPHSLPINFSYNFLTGRAYSQAAEKLGVALDFGRRVALALR
jgi:hypothetical protein